MTDIGKQVRDLLPEYPHLWSRVIAWAEKSYGRGLAQGKIDAAEFLQKVFKDINKKERAQKEPKG